MRHSDLTPEQIAAYEKRLGKARAEAVSAYKVTWGCPECGARVSKQASLTACTRCGATITG